MRNSPKVKAAALWSGVEPAYTRTQARLPVCYVTKTPHNANFPRKPVRYCDYSFAAIHEFIVTFMVRVKLNIFNRPTPVPDLPRSSHCFVCDDATDERIDSTRM